MAAPNEPKDESVRIDLPFPTAGKSSDPKIKPRETVRIQLPLREPLGKPPLDTPTEPQPAAGPAAQGVASTQFSRPANTPSFSPPLSASVMPAPESPSSGPKKETVRMPLVPAPLPAAGQMKNRVFLSNIIFGPSRLCSFSKTANCAIKSPALRAKKICLSGSKRWAEQIFETFSVNRRGAANGRGVWHNRPSVRHA